jgi:transcriptional regulator with XRE-family HTH domain
MSTRQRIITALELSGKTRQALAEKLGVGRGAVSDMLNKEGEFDSLKYLEATAEITGFSFEWLRTGHGPQRPGQNGGAHLGDHVINDLRTRLEALEKKCKEKE